MIDRVNIIDSQRILAPVRPFMVSALARAEERLVEKQEENRPEASGMTWDDVDAANLIDAARRKLVIADAAFPDLAKKDIADAINYLGMAYDVIEQTEEVPDEL